MYYDCPQIEEKKIETVEEAMELSIKKWATIVEKLKEGYEIRSFGAYSCGLCQKFMGCDECPIYKKTGKTSCFGTPYYDFRANQSVKNAEAELVFLQKLAEEQKIVQYNETLIKDIKAEIPRIEVVESDDYMLQVKINESSVYTRYFQALIAIADKYNATFWITKMTETYVIVQFDEIGKSTQPILAKIPKKSELKKEEPKLALKSFGEEIGVFPNPDGRKYELRVVQDKSVGFNHSHLWIVVDGVPKGYWHIKGPGNAFWCGGEFSMCEETLREKEWILANPLDQTKKTEQKEMEGIKFTEFYGQKVKYRVYGDGNHDHLYVFKDGVCQGYFHMLGEGKNSYYPATKPVGTRKY